ncbi:MAG: hypothetical protein COX44_02150 [Candidatus Portnoybacteria bacterium CG23_combo_of_CG06-09_8_20_14_all_37_13]|uniref:Prepilin-type N-terminal cleavage/methylation domain-containing protein n=1 Tax=Candidatus Portnoybacteria bacterium CG23_combo_of_CG06-09_8_20_14_all_37_13 TaxID=1974819 RepID=A0A2G9YCT2_9BACT|nr:MAG: hypothetical protein COX44_02150 [Candidatus Portnoybacteria bacterium CG23_combo_of_CG06-09_8_20_14_all_37_13]
MLKKNNKAFTLIEAIIALTILSLAIIACLQVFALGLKLAQNAKKQTQNILAGQGQVEEALTKPYEQIPGEEVLPGLKKIEFNGLKTYVAN